MLLLHLVAATVASWLALLHLLLLRPPALPGLTRAKEGQLHLSLLAAAHVARVEVVPARLPTGLPARRTCCSRSPLRRPAPRAARRALGVHHLALTKLDVLPSCSPHVLLSLAATEPCTACCPPRCRCPTSRTRSRSSTCCPPARRTCGSRSPLRRPAPRAARRALGVQHLARAHEARRAARGRSEFGVWMRWRRAPTGS